MEALLDRVRSYLADDKVALIERAHDFAARLHEGQSRRSGGPYIEHPVKVAEYLADLSLDAPTIAAALLHDVVEDTEVSTEEVAQEFGADVAKLVDGVTKLQRLDLLSSEKAAAPVPDSSQAASIRKMLVAMAEDIRVVLIKLADRLHNMQTLGAMPPARRVSIAQETLDIYAPLAHRLGMGDVKWQLEDLAFRYLQPNQYRAISRLLSSTRREREAYVHQLAEALRQELALAGLETDVTGRPKHLYSIYCKGQAYRSQGKELSDIHDLFAVRILAHSVQDCYAALGIVHALWRPVPGEFDDYIANPKENLYQSLHTTVRAIGGVPIEVQIRTHRMHQMAEQGVASHWRYKEGGPSDLRFDERMTWLRQLLEWQQELSGAEEFLESVKTDIFKDQVFVYTPKNDIKELPAGATPIDFAYRIHTELGHRWIGAKVNGKLVALDTPLRNGDTAEILTSKVARGPSLNWLNPHMGYVRTATARQAIRAWFRRQRRDESLQRGRELLRKELRRLHATEDDAQVAVLFNLDSAAELYVSLGSGLLSIAQVVSRLTAAHEPQRGQTSDAYTAIDPPAPSLTVLGVGDLLTRIGECCNPLPGDDIIGYVTRSRGVTVHSRGCPNLRRAEEEQRLIPVSWGDSRAYPVRIEVQAMDRVGLLHDVTGVMSGDGMNISGSKTEVYEDGTVTVSFTVQIATIEQLSRLFSRIEGVRGVTGVTRTHPKRTASKSGGARGSAQGARRR